LNVALTRAKASLFILGRAETLRRNALWRELIADARERRCFVEYDEQFWKGVVRNLRPANLVPERKKLEEEQRTVEVKPAPESLAFKIKVRHTG